MKKLQGIFRPSKNFWLRPPKMKYVQPALCQPIEYNVILYRVPHLKLDKSRSSFFHLINNFLMFKIRFHILQIWTFYDISSFFDLLLHKIVFFQKKNFFPYFFQKKLENFLKVFCLKCLLIIFETQL